MSKTVEQKIWGGDYDSQVYFPTFNDVNSGVVTQEEARVQRNKHREDAERLVEAFKADLLAEHELTDHPKADLVFNKAWSSGHANGLIEVLYDFEDLVELVK